MHNFESAKQLFIEGVRFIEANNFHAAEKRLEHSLEIVPERVSTLNNLSAIKIKLEKFAEAEKLARKAIVLEHQSPEAWSNLGIALTKLQRHDEALSAHDRAIGCNASYAAAWLNKAYTLFELNRYDEALMACDQALKLNPAAHEILYTKSRILKELQQPDEARKTYLKSLAMRTAASPVFILQRRETQNANVLVISPDPAINVSLKPFEMLHGANFPSEIGELLNKEFHFAFIFMDDAATPSSRKQIPRPDLVINNNVNEEMVLAEGRLAELIKLVDSFGVPVVNHPTKLAQTTRDASAKHLADIPGVLVPTTRRFSSVGKSREELVHEIENQFDYPLITRPLATHKGHGMTRVDSRDALVEVLASGAPEKIFVTEFVDSRSGNEFFRKIKAAVIKDEILIVRVDYSSYWEVHGRKAADRIPFYSKNANLLDEEKRICANPETELGRSALHALRAIRDRIPLDVFGIDFDVDANGLVVFYEANAVTNMFSTKEVPHPKESDDRLKLAFQRYFTSLLARH